METSRIVSAQREFFSSGKTRPVSFRADALKRLRAAIKEREDDILRALSADLNKPPFEGYMTELGMVYDEISFVLKHVTKWAKDRRVRTPMAQFKSKSFVSPEPYGVVLIIDLLRN